jgi:hypothetical protein
MNWRNFLKPGCLDPRVRGVFFFVFLVITVIQTWLALIMEEELAAIDDKYPENHPGNL